MKFNYTLENSKTYEIKKSKWEISDSHCGIKIPFSSSFCSFTGLRSLSTVDPRSAILTRLVSLESQSPDRMGRVVSFSMTMIPLEVFDY